MMAGTPTTITATTMAVINLFLTTAKASLTHKKHQKYGFRQKSTKKDKNIYYIVKYLLDCAKMRVL